MKHASDKFYRLMWITWWLLIVSLTIDTLFSALRKDIEFTGLILTGILVLFFKTFMLLGFALPMKTRKLKPINYLSFVSLIYVCAGSVWLIGPDWPTAIPITCFSLGLFYATAGYSRAVKQEVKEEVEKQFK